VLDAVSVPKPVDWLGNAWGGHVGLTPAANSPDMTFDGKLTRISPSSEVPSTV
jgi:hypothetical protein